MVPCNWPAFREINKMATHQELVGNEHLVLRMVLLINGMYESMVSNHLFLLACSYHKQLPHMP